MRLKGLQGVPPRTVPIKGPVLIALYGFTAVLVIAALGDAKTVLAGGISRAPRIARHIWRMCLGLTMAAGSAFTNGLPRLLPGPIHVTTFDFLPQFAPLILDGLLADPRAIHWLVSAASRASGVTAPGYGPSSLPRRGSCTRFHRSPLHQ